MKTALVIVDLQNDFLHPRGAYARGGCSNEAALALPSSVAKLARQIKCGGGYVVASQFTLWPDSRGEPLISPHLHTLRPFLKRGDFAPASWGQAVVDELQPMIDVRIEKIAYSAFFQTQLDWLLRRNSIERVAICGIVTNGGVASTVRDSHMRDYETWVVSDACAAFSKTAHDHALADMATLAHVDDTGQFIKVLKTEMEKIQ